MCLSRLKTRIIRLLLAGLIPLLAACSNVVLVYNSGPTLTWWWIDGYFDFSRDQAPLVKQGIDKLFDWHRGNQLALYLPFLASAQAQVQEQTTSAQACRWQERGRDMLEPTLERAVSQAADLLPGLGETQLRYLEKRYAKVLVQMRDDFLQPDPAGRQAESVKRTLERAELLYGRLDAAQKRVIQAGVAASPFNPELWLAERQRRQRDTVQTLRRLIAEKADQDQRVAALRTLVSRVERSPDPEYRAYQVRLAEYNCAFVAQIHNATTLGQRKHALETLRGWESDIRGLIARD